MAMKPLCCGVLIGMIFVLFDSLRPINIFSVIKGRDPLVSSQALNHRATALPHWNEASCQ